MKIVRYGLPGEERPGLIDSDGAIRDLSLLIPDIDFGYTPDLLKIVSQTDSGSLPMVPGSPRLGCPVAKIGKFIGIGLNYRDHAIEAKLAIPDEPAVFMKTTSCIQGPNDPIVLPRHSVKTDWEVEVGVVIGKKAKYVDEVTALDCIAGYCAINDVSERSFQFERGITMDKGKGCDTFGPIGPWLVTADEIPDPANLSMWLDVNGKRMQSGNTRDMIFSIAKIVSYLSEFMSLLPGDVIATGTPLAWDSACGRLCI